MSHMLADYVLPGCLGTITVLQPHMIAVLIRNLVAKSFIIFNVTVY